MDSLPTLAGQITLSVFLSLSLCVAMSVCVCLIVFDVFISHTNVAARFSFSVSQFLCVLLYSVLLLFIFFWLILVLCIT